MYHIAIMNKSWKLIPKIISGEKTIESRWYQTKRAPWNRIQENDVVFFKDSGGPVIAKAIVSRVIQFTINNVIDANSIIKEYGDKICLIKKDVTKWDKLPKYCILIFLRDPQIIREPFFINKKGFGSGVAWMTVDNISKIKE